MSLQLLHAARVFIWVSDLQLYLKQLLGVDLQLLCLVNSCCLQLCNCLRCQMSLLLLAVRVVTVVEGLPSATLQNGM